MLFKLSPTLLFLYQLSCIILCGVHTKCLCYFGLKNDTPCKIAMAMCNSEW